MIPFKNKRGIIRKTDKVEENWNVLFDQIVKGNVIPVIGPELVELGGKTSVQQIIGRVYKLALMEFLLYLRTDLCAEIPQRPQAPLPSEKEV